MLKFLKVEVDDHKDLVEEDEGIYFKATASSWRRMSGDKVRNILLHDALNEIAKNRRTDGESEVISLEFM